MAQRFVSFKHSGFLITLDGTDGAGKSTMTKWLKEWLEDHDYEVITTEWNSSSWMEPAIDDAKERRILTPTTLTLASATDLADRIERDIRPALEKGQVVICDRYISSAVARGVVRGNNEQWIRDLYSEFLLKPNLGFYLYVSPKEARDRLLADKGRVGHHESGSDVLGKEKNQPKDEDETNKRNFIRFMEKQIPIFNRLAKEFSLVKIDTHTKKKKVWDEVKETLKTELDKHPLVLKKSLEATDVPAGKLKIPGASKKVTVYEPDSEIRDDTPSPHFVSENEQQWYDKIHGLQGKTLFKLRQVWSKFKKDFLTTVEKSSNPEDILELAGVNTDQRNMFSDMLDQMDAIAAPAFADAVTLGDAYFTDQFQVNGISAEQQQMVAEKHFGIFQTKASNLFQDDVISNLRENTVDKWFNVLNGFDKYIVGYANAVASVAYDVFTKDITLLNTGIGRAYNLAGQGKSDSIVKVVWVLDPDASHSDDCWNMAELDNFGYGPGVWDAEYLSQNSLVPRSPLLDCGGNCKCHLSPLVPLDQENASWLNNLVRSPQMENILDLIPNMSKPQFNKTIGQLGTVPKELLQLMSEQGFLRRSELWSDLPAFDIDIIASDAFRVQGVTTMDFATELPVGIRLTVEIPPRMTLDTLGVAERNQIINTIAHELGHIVVNDTLATGSPIGIFGSDVAKALYDAAAKERELALGQIQVNFDNTVEQIADGSLTKQMRRDIDIMDIFNSDPTTFLNDLFTAVQKGETFGGVDARQAWNIMDKVLAQYSPGTLVTGTYGLWNTDEYFAEWFTLLLTDPEKAALFSPRLTQIAASVLPEGFFDNAIRQRAANLLPEAISATRRIDLPLPSKFDPIAPNLTDYQAATSGVKSITKKVTTGTVSQEIADIIQSTPNMQRTEFFDGLNINFADKVQIGKRVGSQRAFGFLDPETGTFFVNYDKWKDLTFTQKTDYLADVTATQIYNNATATLKTSIADRFVNYLDASLRFLERKGALEGLRPEDLRTIRETIVGQAPIEDETTGELRGGVPRNLSFWMRNFENTFKPILEQVTDLPVLNVDSLASPQNYFREWVRMYLTSPQNATVYPGFQEILQQYLGLQKSLDFEKAGLGSVAGRILQYFRGAAGRWITTQTGKKIFIAEAGAATAAIASARSTEASLLNLLVSPTIAPGKTIMQEIIDVVGKSELEVLLGETVTEDRILKTLLNWYGDSKNSPLQDAAAYAFNISGKYLRAPDNTMRFNAAVLKGVYKITQDAFAARGIKHVTVYRGLSFTLENTPTEIKALRGATGLINFKSNPLSSFAALEETAKDWVNSLSSGDVRGVLTTTVPVSEILSIPMTGLGDDEMDELVLLGRRIHSGTFAFTKGNVSKAINIDFIREFDIDALIENANWARSSQGKNTFRKAGIGSAVAGLAERALQYFGGKSGYWVTHEGRRIFVAAEQAVESAATDFRMFPVQYPKGLTSFTGTGISHPILGLVPEGVNVLFRSDAAATDFLKAAGVSVQDIVDGFSLKGLSNFKVGELTLAINSAHELQVVGKIAYKGATVGAFERSLMVGDTAYHERFYLGTSVQGLGISKALFRNQINLYQKLGIRQVETHANGEVGSYAWALHGFDWHPSNRATMITRLKTWASMENIKTPAFEKATEQIQHSWDLARFKWEGRRVGKEFLLDKGFPSSYDGYLNMNPKSESHRVMENYIHG